MLVARGKTWSFTVPVRRRPALSLLLPAGVTPQLEPVDGRVGWQGRVGHRLHEKRTEYGCETVAVNQPIGSIPAALVQADALGCNEIV